MTDQANADSWFIAKDGKQRGPLTYQAVLDSIRQGLLTPNDLVWTSGFEKWVPASDIAGLFSPPPTAAQTAPSSVQPPPLLIPAAQPPKVSDVLRDDLLERFVGSSATKKAYYRRVFSQILDEAEVGNKSLDEMRLADFRKWKGLLTKRSGVSTLPFRRDTIFNWAGFFFSVYWMVWRMTYLRWTFVVAFLATTIISDFLPSFWVPLIGIPFLVGIGGNRLLLIQILTELKTGRERSRPTKPWAVIMVLIVAITISITLAARY